MHNLLTNGLFILIAIGLAFSAREAIRSAMARDIISSVVFTLVAIPALVFVVLTLFGFI
jgi:hypothetical protein